MATNTGRNRIAAYLREQGIPFTVEKHHLAYTAQEVAAEGHIPGKMLAKAVAVWAADRALVVLLPAPYQVHPGHLSAALGGVPVHLAREDELDTLFPDCEPGAVPAFGNLYGVPVYVHPALAEQPEIVVQPGSHTETFRLRYADFARTVRPTIIAVPARV